MQYLLELFLNNEFNQTLDEDFLTKQNNEHYIKVIESNPSQYSLFDILKKLKEENKIECIVEEINHIHEEKLYSSFIHGINHNERVLFWGYVLSLQYDLNVVDMRIILDAAKYHDVGRINDYVDPSHGKRSAEVVLELVDDASYQILENRKLLQAIIELHSLEDIKASEIMKKYEIQDKKRFYTLFSILKDADALDRVRITYMRDTVSCLNPMYLRMPYSKQLLKAAHELNEFYMKNEKYSKGGQHEKYLY